MHFYKFIISLFVTFFNIRKQIFYNIYNRHKGEACSSVYNHLRNLAAENNFCKNNFIGDNCTYTVKSYERCYFSRVSKGYAVYTLIYSRGDKRTRNFRFRHSRSIYVDRYSGSVGSGGNSQNSSKINICAYAFCV